MDRAKGLRGMDRAKGLRGVDYPDITLVLQVRKLAST